MGTGMRELEQNEQLETQERTRTSVWTYFDCEEEVTPSEPLEYRIRSKPPVYKISEEDLYKT